MKFFLWILVSCLLIPGVSFAKNNLSLVFAGDVMLGRLVDQHQSHGTAANVFGDTLGILRSGDISIVNQEFAITGGQQKIKPEKVFHFRAGPWAASALKSAGIDYVSLANNHVLDYGVAGLEDTLNILDRKKIYHAGAGKNLALAAAPVVLQASGKKVGIISFTDNMAAWQAGSTRPGINYLPVANGSLNVLKPQIQSLKEQHVDLILLSIHWGGNWDRSPPAHHQVLAKAALDAGVDIIHGHSGHVIQGIEIYKGKPIFYSLGDLIDDYAIREGYRNDLGMIVKTFYGPNNQLEKIEIYPTKISGFKTRLAKDEDFAWVFTTLKNNQKNSAHQYINRGNLLELR